MRVGYKILSPGDEVTTINVGYDGNVSDNNFGDDNILNQEYIKLSVFALYIFPSRIAFGFRTVFQCWDDQDDRTSEIVIFSKFICPLGDKVTHVVAIWGSISA